MDLGLKDRIVLVAGASSGLGLAAALAMAREGCRVAICSRDAGRIEEAAQVLVKQTGASGDHVLPVACDVTDEDQIVAAMRKIRDTYGALHVLVTNAGGPPTGLMDDFDTQTWRTGLELNLVSTINLCRHGLPLLKLAAAQDGHARIVMVTSIAAKQPIGSLYLSNTARAGVQGFAKTLSEEVGPLGITVNTVLPGFTRTERLQHLVDDLMERTGKTAAEVEAGWAASAALRRIADPKEFAAVVTFLASRPASFVTGAAIPIDGGYSKHVF